MKGSSALPGESAPASDQQLTLEGSKVASAHAHYLLARQLESEGHMREALRHYLAYLEQGSFSEMIPHIASFAAVYDGLDAAMDILDRAIESQPDNPQPAITLTQMALTRAANDDQLQERAAKVLARTLEKFPDRAEVYENAVSYYLALGKKDEAQSLLEKALLVKQQDPLFWLSLGRSAQELWPLADSDHRDAHLPKINPYLAKATALALGQGNEEASLQAMDFYLFTNQFPEAIAACEAVVKQKGSLEAHKRLWRLYDASERPAEAFEALSKLVEAYPQDVEHRRYLALHYRNRREWDKAAEHLEAALQAGGGGLSDYLMISNLLLVGKDEEKLDRFTARGEQLFPQDPHMGFFRASALAQLDKFKEAVDLFEKVSKTAETAAPDLLDDSFYFSWGAALERNGEFDEAAQQFDRSIQLTPPDQLERAARTMNYLGYMWLEQNRQLDKAEQLIKKANELVQNEPAYIDSLGWMHFKKGRHAEALKELLRAESLMEELAPEDAEILEHIALTYERLDDEAKAKEYWQKTLDLDPTDEEIRQRAMKGLGMQLPESKPKHPSDEEGVRLP
ncbi:tetratricopeptide repeat protein [Phragmitibacter flavus]|nr:tetratricopeptide repeat protein [Phragmitibacter flavus]